MARGPFSARSTSNSTFLPFLKAVEIKLLKATAVEEYLPAIVGMDEPESTVADDFLYSSLQIWTSIVLKRARAFGG